MKCQLTRDELVADLRITFADLMVRDRNTFLPGGVDIGGDNGQTMPDGLPVFTEFLIGNGEYDLFVHTAFAAWLERRGWYLECVHPLMHCAVPLPTDEERAHWAAESHAYQIATQGPKLPPHLDLPF
jgi:hypothetical protein